MDGWCALIDFWFMFVDDQETEKCACKNHIIISIGFNRRRIPSFDSALEPTAVIATQSRIPFVQFLAVYPLAEKYFATKLAPKKNGVIILCICPRLTDRRELTQNMEMTTPLSFWFFFSIRAGRSECQEIYCRRDAGLLKIKGCVPVKRTNPCSVHNRSRVSMIRVISDNVTQI